jgi:hypothetical protein
MQVCMFCREKFDNYGFGGIFCSTSCETAYERIQRDQIEQIERLREANRPNSYSGYSSPPPASYSSPPSTGYSSPPSSRSGCATFISDCLEFIESFFNAIIVLFSLIGNLIYGLFLFGIMFAICSVFPPLFFVVGGMFLLVILGVIIDAIKNS